MTNNDARAVAASAKAGPAAAHEPRGYLGDILGGLASMLVALPSAIAFGLLVYSPLGARHAGEGAMAGILGAIAIGLIAPAFGGAPRLISGPSAPAAAVLAALVAQVAGGAAGNSRADSIPLIITLVALFAGGLQFLYGRLGGGKLIKYIPYPVVAGYLSGVGILIVLGQLPKFLGLARGVGLWAGIMSPASWRTPALVIGVVSIAIMILAPRITRAIPAPIIAMLGGIAAYFGMSFVYRDLLSLAGNSLVIGEFGGGENAGFVHMFLDRLTAIKGVRWGDLSSILMPVFTLSVLLSIDTLKTCVVMDALTRTRHNSNRELLAQGLANMTSGLCGGLAGSGTMAATLVNLNSGGRTRLSGISAGAFTLAAFLIFDRLVAWVPVAALAGILIVGGFRMVDRHIYRLLRHTSTYLDFLVVAVVVLTALFFDLMTAAGMGVGLAILLFLRDQIRGSVVRHRAFGNQIFSKKRRLPHEVAILLAKGDQTCVVDLQGALFFGTTDQLFSDLEPILPKCRHLILNMRRIQSVDFTATHMLEQIEAQIADHGGCLIFADLPVALPTGQDLQTYFDQVGLLGRMGSVKIFPELDDALEWAEERILESESAGRPGDEKPLELGEMHLTEGLPAEVISSLGTCVVEGSYKAGERIFGKGDHGDELFMIRKGQVRIVLPLTGGKTHHLGTFGAGDFFGDMAFLDNHPRSADAFAENPVELFIMSRARLDRLVAEHPQAGIIFSRIAHVLATRLRQTDAELASLRES